MVEKWPRSLAHEVLPPEALLLRSAVRRQEVQNGVPGSASFLQIAERSTCVPPMESPSAAETRAVRLRLVVCEEAKPGEARALIRIEEFFVAESLRVARILRLARKALQQWSQIRPNTAHAPEARN